MYSGVDTAGPDQWTTSSSSPFASTPSTPHSFTAGQDSDLLPDLVYIPPSMNVYGASMGFVSHDVGLIDSASQFATPGDVGAFVTPGCGYGYGPEADLSYQMSASNAMAGGFGFIQPTFTL